MVLTLDQAIDNSKSAKERHQKLLDAAVQAKQAGDEDAEANYLARAEVVRPQAEAEIANASVRPGGANIEALGMQVNKPAPIAPPRAPLSQQVPLTPSQGERVRVRNKDGQIGSVPRSQLQQALSSGFQEVK